MIVVGVRSWHGCSDAVVEAGPNAGLDCQPVIHTPGILRERARPVIRGMVHATGPDESRVGSSVVIRIVQSADVAVGLQQARALVFRTHLEFVSLSNTPIVRP